MSHLLAPGYGQGQPHLLAPSGLSPYALAPDAANMSEHYEPSGEEVEVLRVGLFIDILNYEFRMHKGFESSDYGSLYKYWVKNICKGEFWSARKEIKKINIRKLVKEGVLTVDTQKRLYGDDAWFPQYIEDEREKTIEWLKSLDPEDVQHTLYAYYEGGLKTIREQVLRKQKPQGKAIYVKPRKNVPVFISEIIHLEVALAVFKEQMGYTSKNPADLAKAAVKYKTYPKLLMEFAKQIKINSKKTEILAPVVENEEFEAKKYLNNYLEYDEEDFEVSFEKYFRESLGKKPDGTGNGLKNLKPLKKNQGFVNLPSSCAKALSTQAKYDGIPQGFDNIELLRPHVKAILCFLKKFYEEKVGLLGYPAHEFTDFCLRNSFPVVKDEWWDDKKSGKNSFNRSRTVETPNSDASLRENKVLLSESEVRMHLNHFSTMKMMLIRLHLIFTEFHGYSASQGKVLFQFWKKIKPIDKNFYSLWVFPDSSESFSLKPVNSKENVQIIENFYIALKESRIEKSKENVEKEQKVKNKLKEKYQNPKRTNLAESKKGRWALGNKLLEIQKRFPLDPVIKSMVKVEFGVNPLKKYDLEYETHNADDELKRKQGQIAYESIKSPQKSKLSLDEVIKLQYNRLKYIEEHAVKSAEQIKQETAKRQEGPMFKSIREMTKQYLKFRETGHGSISLYLSNSYFSLKTQFPLAVQKNFPYKNYGAAKKKTGEVTFSKSFPIEFKHYFFAVFKSLLKTPKGIIMLKSTPALIWAPPSKSKCTIHSDVCPPNCMFISLNKKILRQTMKSEPYCVSWHSKLRPFFRPDMSEEKQKIFMSYADARECRFEPVVGSKVPEKHLALTFKHFSEIRSKINPEEAPNFNMWVNKLGMNLKSSDPGLFKEGVFKQAKALFIQNQLKEAKDLLSEHFNMPCILDYFLPGNPRPDINEKPLEDFNKPANLELMTNVFNLQCAIKLHYQQARKQLETIKKLEEFDKKTLGNFSKTSQKHDKSVKKFMCPDEKCSKIGCEFAHNNSEVRFRQEAMVRTNYKQKLLEKLKDFQPIKRTPWVPSGKLVDCINCHSNFLYKPEPKGQKAPPPEDRPKQKRKLADPQIVAWSRSKCCNKCSLQQRLKEKQENFMKKSKQQNDKILQKSGRNNYDVTGDQVTRQRELLISDKIGKYRKARTLYKLRKYVETYEVMKKVIEMVRKERTVDQESVQKKLFEIRKTIGLENVVIEESANDESNENFQEPDKKIMLFKTQTNRLNQGSSNDFLNYQIESFFNEVEKKLKDENSYITNLREKANTLDEAIEAPDAEMKKSGSFLFKPKKVKICKFVKDGKKCPKGPACEFAHFSTQLDLVPTTKVIQNLYHTSEALDKKLKEDILPPDWKPWRNQRPLPIYPPLPLPKDLTKDKDLDKTLPFDS